MWQRRTRAVLIHVTAPYSLRGIEQAGGAATNGRERIMGLTPTKLHERVAVVLGSKNEVERVTRYHLEAGQ